jgi:hypothetical protein
MDPIGFRVGPRLSERRRLEGIGLIERTGSLWTDRFMAGVLTLI